MKQSRIACRLLAVAILLPLGWGCSRSEPPRFRLNEVEIASKELPADQQQVIADVLYALFGTPDNPHVPAESGLDQRRVEIASGPVWSDTHGIQRGLYRQHCGHCHGTTGDGMGPTAAVLHPYPRDYRKGLFKFKSTQRTSEPTAHDLEYIIRQGANGTAMPSFNLLPEDEIAALVEYVEYLSMRGMTEIGLINVMSTDMGTDDWKELAKSTGVWAKNAKSLRKNVASEDDEAKLTESEILQIALAPEGLLEVEKAFLAKYVVGEDKVVAEVGKKWKEAPETIIQPPERSEMTEADLEASIAKGRDLFYGAKAQCVKCHGPSQLGDGQTSDYDEWTKPLVDMAKQVEESRKSIAADTQMSSAERARALAVINAKARALEYDSLPPRTITPRNLRLGIYRGGGRPLDLYRRVHAGINGTPMPSISTTPGITPDDMWNLVDFVRSLPYESISRPQRMQRFAGREQL